MLRTFETLKDGEWKCIPFINIRKGDIFRMFDGNVPVKDEWGNVNFLATADANVVTGTIDCYSFSN